MRPLQRWVGGRDENRVERLGIGMWQQHMMTGASGDWHISYLCSPTQKMGGTQMLGGWESCKVHRSPLLDFDGGGGVVGGVVVILEWLWAQSLHSQVLLQHLKRLDHHHCWRPDLCPTFLLDISPPPACSLHALLPQHPSPGSTHSTSAEHNYPHPHHHHHRHRCLGRCLHGQFCLV